MVKKTAWEKSKFGRLTGVNVLNALAHAFATAIPTFFGLVNANSFLEDFKITIYQASVATIIAFISAFFFDILKRMGFTKKED